MQSDIKELCTQKAKEFDRMVEKFLPEENGYQKTVLEAMNYSIRVGGKRLRPIMMQEVYRMFGGSDTVIEPFMAAMEMIHTYSLVHDDLPAMDNDEYRRGKKTTHAVYGEAMGILAGDGLLNYAFEVVSDFVAKECENDPEKAVTAMKALSILSKKAGAFGMIGGQCADLEFEHAKEQNMEALLFIHENKTAALIQAAMMVGAVLAGAKEEQIEAIEKIGYNIGIAFQIQDDILDVIGDSKELGKNVGSDEKNDKLTYVKVYGLEKSKEDVKILSEEAVRILSELQTDGRLEEENFLFLEELILFLTTRRK